jgi:hypothetical protein
MIVIVILLSLPSLLPSSLLLLRCRCRCCRRRRCCRRQRHRHCLCRCRHRRHHSLLLSSSCRHRLIRHHRLRHCHLCHLRRPFPLVASLPPASGDDDHNVIVVVIVVVCLSSVPAGCHFSLSSVVIDLCRRCRHCPRPHQGPHTVKLVTAANATSRALVIVLFGPVAAVWAAVEGMTMLPSNGSGFGRGSCFACWYIFYVFLP